MAANENILIDLSRSKNPSQLDTAQLIQQDAWHRVHREIKIRVERLSKTENEEYQNSICYPRVHDTIAVFGRRGDGKSTFVLNVLDVYSNARNRNKDDSDLYGKGVQPLGIMDPTLVENKENPFLNIVRTIRQLVEEELEARGAYASEKDRRETWKRSLNKLARGFKVLDGIGRSPLNQDEWEDEQYIFEEGMKNMASGHDLERHFDEFLKESLKILNKKVFLLAFDDVDTDFKKGWIILELLRKYLTSPRLLVILAADQELTINLIRKHQWEMLGDLPAKEMNPAAYKEVVRELEEQYLLKILKTENRVTLRSVYDNFDKIRIQGEYEKDLAEDELKDKNKECISLKSLVDEMLRDYFFLRNQKDIDLYSRILCTQSTRTVIQLLYSFTRSRVIRSSAGIYPFYEDLTRIFLSTLTSHGIRVEKLPLSRDSTPWNQLALDLTALGLWEEGYRLKPYNVDHELNPLLTVLGSVYARSLQDNPSSIWEYFIKIGWTREIFSQQDKSRAQSEVNLRYLGHARGEDSLYCSRKMLGLLGFVENEAWSPGIIPLYSSNTKTKIIIEGLFGSAQSRDLLEKISDFYKNEFSDDNKSLFNTPETFESRLKQGIGSLIYVFVSGISYRQGEVGSFLSFYNLIGFLADLVKEPDKNLRKNLLSESTIFKAYPTPGSSITGSEDEEQIGDEVGENGESIENTEIIHPFFAILNRWCDHGGNTEFKVLPPIILSKISSRIATCLETVHRQTTKKYRLAGKLLHRYSVLFLNAVLVESLLDMEKIPENINRKNPTGSDDIFLENLEIFSQQENRGKLIFSWIWACPFWGMILNPKRKEQEETVWSRHCSFVTEFSKEVPYLANLRVEYKFKDKSNQYPNLHDLLDSLAVRGLKILEELKPPVPESQEPKGLHRRRGSAIKALNWEKREIIKSSVMHIEKESSFEAFASDVCQIINKHFIGNWYTSGRFDISIILRQWAEQNRIQVPSGKQS